MKGFEKLLSPIEIAPNFVLKNRMIKAPQSRPYCGNLREASTWALTTTGSFPA